MREKILLDTNIVTYILSLATWADLYWKHIEDKEQCISFMTFAELLEKAYRQNMSPRRIAEQKKYLTERFTVMQCDNRLCEIFARIRSERRNKPISVGDAWVAATAIAYGLPLVTHNARDFEGISDLTIITEYQ